MCASPASRVVSGGAPQQAVLGQQQVGRFTSSAARPLRTTALFGPTVAHHAHSGPTQGRSRSAQLGQDSSPASRARPTSGASVATIFTFVSGHQEGPSRHSAKSWSGRVLARTGLGTLSPGAKKGNPKVALIPSPCWLSLHDWLVFSWRDAQQKGYW